jgi:hypothetical protein
VAVMAATEAAAVPAVALALWRGEAANRTATEAEAATAEAAAAMAATEAVAEAAAVTAAAAVSWWRWQQKRR